MITTSIRPITVAVTIVRKTVDANREEWSVIPDIPGALAGRVEFLKCTYSMSPPLKR